MQSQCTCVHMHQHTREHISICTHFMCTLTPTYSQPHTYRHGSTLRHMHMCAHQHTHWPTRTHTWAAKHWQDILHSLHLHAHTHTSTYIHPVIPSSEMHFLSPHPVPSLKKGQGLPDGWDGQARPLPLAYPDPNCPGQL